MVKLDLDQRGYRMSHTPAPEPGHVYENWTVLETFRDEKGLLFSRCACRCGKVKEVRVCALKGGKSKSCGCIRNAAVKKNMTEWWANNFMKGGKSNKTGYPGVIDDGTGKYRARIRTSGKTTYLGVFDNPKDAYQAYVNAKRKQIEALK